MSDDDTNAVAAYLKDHPRAVGVLFAMMLALSQAGTAAANSAGATLGP